jgi:hypothetical protein
MEILSRPQVMTLDNQEAFIQVGQSVPRIASSSITQFGQVNTVQDTQVGLLLGVIPRINPDGTVVMEVDATKSNVGSENNGIPIFVSAEGQVVRTPRINIASAQTTVSAASGQTIVIGGLITTENESDHRKVPWLGDLPVLGKLFRYDSYTNRRSELLIILTPHVVLGRGDAEYLKQVEMSRMSWVSSDVFEFIGTSPEEYRIDDDSGVEIIYPDATPEIGDSIPEASPTSDPMTPVPQDPNELPNVESIPHSSLDHYSIDNANNDFDPEFDQVSYRLSKDTGVDQPTTDATNSVRPDTKKKPGKRRSFFRFNGVGGDK